RQPGGATAFCDYDPFGAAYDLGHACPEDVAFAGQGRDAGTGWYRLRAPVRPQGRPLRQPRPGGYSVGGALRGARRPPAARTAVPVARRGRSARWTSLDDQRGDHPCGLVSGVVAHEPVPARLEPL